MTRKVGDTPKSAAPVKASSSKPAAKKTTKSARAKAFGAKKPTAGKQSFPRTTWQDTNKLGKEIEKSQAALARHPRIIHSKPSGGTVPPGHKPPVQMKYGGPTPGHKPPIQMKYGGPTPPPKPPIQARYGVPTPNPNKPPIQMKYGAPRPNPDKPPIQMKYGAPRPNPDKKTDTKKA